MVQAYNNWFTRWKAEDDKIRKGVASWYQEKLNMEWEQKIRKIQNRKVVGKKNGTEGRDYQFAGLPQDW
ncbi:MAG: hypothetical protein K0S18_1329 [Anaerocolumna sp.]|nr:hypothetical protein [Anaerocolumna sp.]